MRQHFLSLLRMYVMFGAFTVALIEARQHDVFQSGIFFLMGAWAFKELFTNLPKEKP